MKNLFIFKRKKLLILAAIILIIFSVGLLIKFSFKPKAEVLNSGTVNLKLVDFEGQPVKAKVIVNKNEYITDFDGQTTMNLPAGNYPFIIFDADGKEMTGPNLESILVKSGQTKTLIIDDLYPVQEKVITKPADDNIFTSTLNHEGWNFISFAAAPLDPAPDKTLADIPLNELHYNLYRYSNVAMGYIVYDKNNPQVFGSLRVGEGYWLNIFRPVQISYRGFLLPKEMTNLRVNSGWSIIGVPKDQSVALADILVKKLSSGETVSYPDAYNNKFWVGQAYAYRTGVGYDLVAPVGATGAVSNQFEPWQGYWLYVFENVELIFP